MPFPATRDPEGTIRLRDVSRSDLGVLYEHQSDPEASRMAAFPIRDRKAFYAHWDRILRDRSLIKKTILLDGVVAGNVVSFERNGVREVGYWIGRSFWGRGIATRALAQLLEQIAIRPLYARVALHNVASIRVLTKCGFSICHDDLGPVTGLGDGVEELLLKLEA
jgi:RimJ/RimL family protein N-acetyltransferase